jgi:DNA-binding IclR family transcriptional regulator
MGRILLSSMSDQEIRELYSQDLNRSFNLSPYLDIAELLKQIATDRAEGVVVQSSGYEPGVASVAAPIRDVSGRTVAAINVSAVALLANEVELNGPLRAEVLAAAAAISRDLGQQTEPVQTVDVQNLQHGR